MEGEFKAFYADGYLAPGRQSWLPVLMYMVGLISKITRTSKTFLLCSNLASFLFPCCIL